MMKRILLCGALALAFAGCKQGVGDRCQVDDDCDTGLICVYNGTPNTAVGGVCGTTPGGTVDAAPTDAKRDAPPIDAVEQTDGN